VASSPPLFVIMKINAWILLVLALLLGFAWVALRPAVDRPAPAVAPEAAPPPAADPAGAEAVVPALEADLEPPPEPDAEDWDEEGPAWEDEDFFDIPISEDGFDAMPVLSPVTQLSRTIEDLQYSTLVSLDEYGRTMLSSTSATLRAVGGILMFKAQAMDASILRQLAADGDVAVPFLVLEWIRDYGTPAMAGELAGLLKDRQPDLEQLADDLLAGKLAMGGGRAAVDFLADQLPAEECWDVLLEVAGNEDVEYDLRMRSILRLAAAEDGARFREELVRLQESAQEEGEDWAEAVQRLSERLMNDEGTDLAAQDEITMRDLHLIVGNEHLQVVRDIVLYLEDRLLTPGVVAEPGSADLIAEFLKDFPDRDQDWNVEDEEALQRLEALLERVVALESIEEEDGAADESSPSKE
jgi:hypothetical protein